MENKGIILTKIQPTFSFTRLGDEFWPFFQDLD
jgi:hypothetical protein